MAYKFTCGCCHEDIIDQFLGVVEYGCGHVEHTDCYYRHHPHNRMCIQCGYMSYLLCFYSKNKKLCSNN